MRFFLVLVLNLCLLLSVYGKYPINLTGEVISKISGNLTAGTKVKLEEIYLVELERSRYEIKAKIVCENGKQEIIDYNDIVKKIKFLLYNNADFWKFRILKYDVFSNILKHGEQYDLRKSMEEEALEFLSEYESKNLFFNDDYIEDYLYSILYKIFPMTLEDGRLGILNLKILKDIEPNAFIYSNGTLIISTGLLSVINSEEELIGVLAHEIAHFVLDHSIININKAQERKERAAFWAGFATVLAGAADIALAHNNKSYMPGLLTFSTASLSTAIASSAIERLGLSYSREQEMEADECASDIMKYMNKEPGAFAMLLSKIKTYCIQTGNYHALSGKGTHPAIDDRILKFESIKQTPVGDYDIIMSPVISYCATSELNAKHFKTCISLVDRNIISKTATEEDYLNKAKSSLYMFDTVEKNTEALQLIQIAKRVNIKPMIELDKQEALVLLRLNRKLEAIKCLESYLSKLSANYESISQIKHSEIWLMNYNYNQSEMEWASQMIRRINALN